MGGSWARQTSRAPSSLTGLTVTRTQSRGAPATPGGRAAEGATGR